MKRLTSINEVLDFAIAGEVKSQELYMEMAAKAENPWMRKTLERLAQEEQQHRAKLEKVKAGKIALGREQVDDLGIADTLEEIKPDASMDYREFLVFAIKKENRAHKLYARLASIFSEPDLSSLFNKLAAEEADHKRRFEVQYESLTS